MSRLINRIMRSLESGMNEKDIKSNVGGSKRLIAKCKKEYEARNNIERLTRIGKLDEAQEVADEFELKAIHKDTLFALLELAIKNRDIQKEREILKILQDRQLNYEEQKRSLHLALELESDNIEYFQELIRIARKEEDYEQVRRLTDKKRSLEKAQLYKKRQKMFQTIQLEEFGNEGAVIGNLGKARTLIYQGTDIQKTLEEINKMLEGEDEITRVLVEAEFLAHAGLKKRAETLLKEYMKKLDTNFQMKEIRNIKRAIELAKSSKTMPYNWEEFWCGKEKIPSTIGEDEGAR